MKQLDPLENQVKHLSELELLRAEDTALADLALAQRYEHNRHLIPGLEHMLKAIDEELNRRIYTLGYTPPVKYGNDPLLKNIRAIAAQALSDIVHHPSPYTNDPQLVSALQLIISRCDERLRTAP